MNEPGQHGADSIGPFEDRHGFVFDDDSHAACGFDVDGDLTGFASCFGKPLALLRLGISVGTFADEPDRPAGCAKHLIRRVSIPARDLTTHSMDRFELLHGEAIDLEAVVGELELMGLHETSLAGVCLSGLCASTAQLA
jgi:hypothetical protein